MIASCLLWLFAVAGPSVAITFDDLPAAGTMNPDQDRALTTADVRAINGAILRTLRAHHVPAIGFVNERGIAAYPDSAERRAIVAGWTAAGMDLGNHTWSHPDFNALSVEQFRAEVDKGEASIAPLMRAAGRKLSFFRFPMNHTGDTQEKKEAAARYLQERGYAIAVCTIENEDFAFERAFRVALANGDTDAAKRIHAAYLRYTESEIDYYRSLHRKLFGRDTAQVMLLHVNRLNAQSLDEVLRLFEERGYHFVSLHDAQADPAFHTPEPQANRFGPMWAYRWARTLGARIDGSEEAEPPSWVLAYGQHGAR